MNSKFWIKRVKEYGHTGWSDKMTYLYDQKLRLMLLEKIINKYFNQKIKYALDYGCGSGDFSNLLGGYSEDVLGVDIAKEIISVAREKYPHIAFDEIDSYRNNKYEFIIAITVLQHLLDDNDLKNVLMQFNEVVEKNGIIVIIDSYSNNGEYSEYLKLRKYQDFLELVLSHNFEILETHNLYHPQKIPTELYELYRKSFFVRVLNKLNFYFLLNKVSSVVSRFDNALVLNESSTKLTIIRKI